MVLPLRELHEIMVLSNNEPLVDHLEGGVCLSLPCCNVIQAYLAEMHAHLPLFCLDDLVCVVPCILCAAQQLARSAH